jgi:hypothetical protein
MEMTQKYQATNNDLKQKKGVGYYFLLFLL